MFPTKHGVIFRTPEQHQPPDDISLAGNTYYPNLNSRDYAKRPLNRHIRMHKAWECISINSEQEAVIATNKLSGREWSGSLWGFEEIGDGGMLKPSKAAYKLQCQTLVSCLRFVSDNIVGLNNLKDFRIINVLCILICSSLLRCVRVAYRYGLQDRRCAIHKYRTVCS